MEGGTAVREQFSHKAAPIGVTKPRKLGIYIILSSLKFLRQQALRPRSGNFARVSLRRCFLLTRLTHLTHNRWKVKRGTWNGGEETLISQSCTYRCHKALNQCTIHNAQFCCEGGSQDLGSRLYNAVLIVRVLTACD